MRGATADSEESNDVGLASSLLPGALGDNSYSGDSAVCQRGLSSHRDCRFGRPERILPFPANGRANCLFKNGALGGGAALRSDFFSVVSPSASFPVAFSGEAILVLLVILGALTRRVLIPRLRGDYRHGLDLVWVLLRSLFTELRHQDSLRCATRGRGCPFGLCGSGDEVHRRGSLCSRESFGRTKLSPRISPKNLGRSGGGFCWLS